MLPQPNPFRRGLASRLKSFHIIVCAVLAIIAAVYLQTAFFEFAYDDFGQIVYNDGIKSWRLALNYFSSHVWAQTGGISYYYRPVFMLWLTANYAVFGQHPLYWHLAAIALHVLACGLFYLFLYRLTQDRWTSLVAALLFGLHPAHVEAVAWISGATESLMAALLFGSLLCYQRSRDFRSGRSWFWAASLFLAGLAVLAKETAIMLPAVVFSYEWLLGVAAKRRDRLLCGAQAAAPYAIVSCGFLVLRALALHRLTPPRTADSLSSVLFAWPKILIFYGVHALLPVRLSEFYELMIVRRPGVENFLLPCILVSVVALLLTYLGRRSRVIAFWTLWCAILLAPAFLLTLSYNVENLHDRYLYLPLASLCVLVASALWRLKQTGRNWATLVVLAVIGAGYAVVTFQESQYWRNDTVLGQHSLAMTPGNALAEQLLGNAYIRDGRSDEAIPHLLDSLEAQPDNSDTLRSLGLCYLEGNALPLAEQALTKSMARNNGRPETHLLLGEVRLKQNRLEEAESEFRRGLELHRSPNVVLLHYYLGQVRYARGDFQGALQEYRLELKNDAESDPVFANAKQRIEEIEHRARL
jgi:tetratricopeptide (TPR) repeat protein